MAGGDVFTFPHLHISSSVLSERALATMHLPTKHLAAEDVLRLLIEEFGVRARRGDWQSVLAETRRLLETEPLPLAT